MRTRAILLPFLAVTMMGCGSPTVPTAGSNPSASPPPPVTITESDFGHSVKATVGQTIKVQLTDTRPVPGSSLVWTVSSSDPHVLELTSAEHAPGAPAHDSSYTASLVAHRAGTAKIHAAGATTCEAMLKSSCQDRSADVTVEVS